MSQTGKFFAGTYGYPVTIRLGISLAEVSAITLEIKGPQIGLITRELVLEDAITNEAAGIVTYIIQNGDLQLPGEYLFRLIIDKPGNRRLVAVAPMQVG